MHWAMNFTDVVIFTLLNNHNISILVASYGWKLRQRSNWLKVTLFGIGKEKKRGGMQIPACCVCLRNVVSALSLSLPTAFP